MGGAGVMAEQLSLFGSPEPEETTVASASAAAPAKPEPAPEPIAAYASVVLDIPTRALSEPFAYGIPQPLANEVQIGSTVLVHFGNRSAAGYIVDIAPELGDLQGNNALDPVRIKAIEAILSKPLFTAEAARIARWMSREYVATLSECLRLFLPPGGSPRVVKGDDGAWSVERPAVIPIQNRWVMLTPEGFDYTPPKTAVRQRQLIEALQCGPVTTRDLNLLYNSMSATIKALEKRGVVVVEERRAWRGCSEQTTLSSASGKAPVALTKGQQKALAQIERARLDAHGDVVLVDGVTGSGKTEVYLSAIERVLAAGRSACVLVPEISLTAQTVGRFRSRFGETVAVFHSRLSAGERLDQWDMVASGAARVVVGARSALFCPLSDLGLIIIDEEHETSYKQG
ncbi:MAG: DEAD/DEAH box helicase, partial [Collinsella sp.]|nr:DEAD/DEAH box helicase [Collinsella sp.]